MRWGLRDISIASDDGSVVSFGAGIHSGEPVVLDLRREIVAGAKVKSRVIKVETPDTASST